MGVKYCGFCKRYVTPKKYNGVLLVLLFLFFIIPGIIYFIYCAASGGRCPICSSKNWVPAPPEMPQSQYPPPPQYYQPPR